MQLCPLFNLEPPTWYLSLLNSLFGVTLLVNALVIPCILFCTPKAMASYKWYLLWNQSFTALLDCSISFFVQPIIFVPFQMGFPAGIFKGIVPARFFAYLGNPFQSIVLATIVHLFIYRFRVIHGEASYRYVYIFFIGLPYALPFILMVQIVRSYDDDQLGLLEKMSLEYTCVSASLINVPNLLTFDRDTLSFNTHYLLLFNYIFVISEALFCIFASWRLTSFDKMSAQLKKLQRKLLIQLVVQTFLPFLIFGVPSMLYVYYMSQYWSPKAFTVGLITMATISSFSIIQGLTLILLNSTYRSTLRSPWKNGTLARYLARKLYPSQQGA